MHGHSGTSGLFTVKNILPALHTKTTFGDDIYHNPSTAPICSWMMIMDDNVWISGLLNVAVKVSHNFCKNFLCGSDKS